MSELRAPTGFRLHVSDDEFDTAALHAESVRARAQAQRIEIDDAGFDAAVNAIRGARRHLSATGELLAELHETRALARCEAVTGLALRPTRSA